MPHYQPPTYNPQPTMRPSPTPLYVCLYPACPTQAKRLADLERHVSIVHNRETHTLVDCAYSPECRRRGSLGFTRKDKMIEHMRDVHKCDIPKRAKGRRESGSGGP